MNLLEGELRRNNLGGALDQIRSGYGSINYTKRVPIREPGSSTTNFIDFNFPIEFLVNRDHKGHKEIRFVGNIDQLVTKLGNNATDNFYYLKSHRELQLQLAKGMLEPISLTVSDLKELTDTVANRVLKTRGSGSSISSRRLLVKAVADVTIPIDEGSYESFQGANILRPRSKRRLYYALVNKGGDTFELHVNPLVGHFDNFDFDGDAFELIEFLETGKNQERIRSFGVGIKYPTLIQGMELVAAEEAGWKPNQLMQGLGRQKLGAKEWTAGAKKGFKVRTRESELQSAAYDRELVGTVNNMVMLADLYLAQDTLKDKNKTIPVLKRYFERYGWQVGDLPVTEADLLTNFDKIMQELRSSPAAFGTFMQEARPYKQSGYGQEIIEEAIKAVTMGKFDREKYPELQSLLDLKPSDRQFFLGAKRLEQQDPGTWFEMVRSVFKPGETVSEETLANAFLAKVVDFHKARNKPIQQLAESTDLVRKYNTRPAFDLNKVVTESDDVFSQLISTENRYGIIQLTQVGDSGALGLSMLNEAGIPISLLGARDFTTGNESMAIFPKFKVLNEGKVLDLNPGDWLREEFNRRAAEQGLFTTPAGNSILTGNLLQGEFDPERFIGNRTAEQIVSNKLYPSTNGSMVNLRRIIGEIQHGSAEQRTRATAELTEAVRVYHLRVNFGKTASLLREISNGSSVEARVKRKNGQVEIRPEVIERVDHLRILDIGKVTNVKEDVFTLLKTMVAGDNAKLHVQGETRRFGTTTVGLQGPHVGGTRLEKIGGQEFDSVGMKVNIFFQDAGVLREQILRQVKLENGRRAANGEPLLSAEEQLTAAQNGAIFMGSDFAKEARTKLAAEGLLTPKTSRNPVPGWSRGVDENGQPLWLQPLDETILASETGPIKALSTEIGLKNMVFNPEGLAKIGLTSTNPELKKALVDGTGLTLFASTSMLGELKAGGPILQKMLNDIDRKNIILDTGLRKRVEKLITHANDEARNRDAALEASYNKEVGSVIAALTEFMGVKANIYSDKGVEYATENGLLLTDITLGISTDPMNLGLQGKSFLDDSLESAKHPTQNIDMLTAIGRSLTENYGVEARVMFDRLMEQNIADRLTTTVLGANDPIQSKAFVETVFSGANTIKQKALPAVFSKQAEEPFINNLANDIRRAVSNGGEFSTIFEKVVKKLY